MPTRKSRPRTALTRLWLQTLEARDNPAPIAYAVRSDGDDRLYRIDLGTSTFAPVGPGTGFGDIEAVSFSTTNFKLYGIDDGTGALVTIDITTGVASRVAGTGIPIGSNPGMAFDVLGNLYVANDNDGAAPNAKNQRGNLYKVDPNTGATTVVGKLGRGLQGLSFAANGTLYGVDEVNNVLVTVDTATGATTVVGKTGVFPTFPAAILGTASADIGLRPDIGAGIAFDNAGNLYGVDDDNGLFLLNKATGAGALTGTGATLFEDLAIIPFGGNIPPVVLPPPIPLPPPATAVPLPGTGVFPAGASVAGSLVFTNPVGVSLVNPGTGASATATPPFVGIQTSTAVADLTGDKIPDVVFAPGVGGGPVVIIADGASNSIVRTFGAFDPNFRGGLSVATGDVTGDGQADIVVSVLSGGGPVVRVFDGATFTQVASFFAFDPLYQGGVNVAVGDVNGDGRADIIASTNGVGGPGLVKVIDGTKLTQFDGRGVIRDSALVGGTGFAPLPGFLGGINVAVGNFDNDRFADLVVTPGGGGGPVAFTFSGAALTGGATAPRSTFAATGFEGFFGGLSVTTTDIDGDGLSEVVVTPQFGGGPIVRGYNVATGQTVLTTVVGGANDRAGGDIT